MRYDKERHDNLVLCFMNSISQLMGDKMQLLSESTNWNRYSDFELEYLYIPRKLNIRIQNQMDLFTIDIIDEDGAHNTLQRIEKFNNSLTEPNILAAIKVLQRTLSMDYFNLYVYKDGKVYKKIDNKLYRVRDTRNL